MPEIVRKINDFLDRYKSDNFFIVSILKDESANKKWYVVESVYSDTCHIVKMVGVLDEESLIREFKNKDFENVVYSNLNWVLDNNNQIDVLDMVNRVKNRSDVKTGNISNLVAEVEVSASSIDSISDKYMEIDVERVSSVCSILNHLIEMDAEIVCDKVENWLPMPNYTHKASVNTLEFYKKKLSAHVIYTKIEMDELLFRKYTLINADNDIEVVKKLRIIIDEHYMHKYLPLSNITTSMVSFVDKNSSKKVMMELNLDGLPYNSIATSAGFTDTRSFGYIHRLVRKVEEADTVIFGYDLGKRIHDTIRNYRPLYSHRFDYGTHEKATKPANLTLFIKDVSAMSTKSLFSNSDGELLSELIIDIWKAFRVSGNISSATASIIKDTKYIDLVLGMYRKFSPYLTNKLLICATRSFDILEDPGSVSSWKGEYSEKIKARNSLKLEYQDLRYNLFKYSDVLTSPVFKTATEFGNGIECSRR